MLSLIVGGSGALGRSFVHALNTAGYKAINIDLKNNADAYRNILVNPDKTMKSQIKDIVSNISSELGGSASLSSVFCTAGGWKAGSIRDDDFLESLSYMHTINVETAAVACHIASKYVTRGGLVMLTGASVALQPTPSTLAYGISKTSTHFMVESVAKDPYFVQNKISVLGVLPQVIDTTANRERLSAEDSNEWTKPEEISQKCVAWVSDTSNRPKTGSLLNVRSSRAESFWME